MVRVEFSDHTSPDVWIANLYDMSTVTYLYKTKDFNICPNSLSPSLDKICHTLEFLFPIIYAFLNDQCKNIHHKKNNVFSLSTRSLLLLPNMV